MMRLSEVEPNERERLTAGLVKVIEKKGVEAKPKDYTSNIHPYSQGSYTSKPVEPDPDGTKKVFYWGKLNFFGSSKANVKAADPKWSLIIDLTGGGWKAGYTEKKVTTISVGEYGLGADSTLAQKLQEFLTETTETVYPEPQPHLKIAWPDYGIIPGNTDFWEFLMNSLPDEGNILVNCQGGKGRTGTALAAMFMAANALGKKHVGANEAIGLVRKQLHSGAVESKSQEQYLEFLSKEWAKELGVKE
jgi:protein-tyrosine phosphatase